MCQPFLVGSIGGRVTAGGPVSGLIAAVDALSDITDGNGNYYIQDLAPGTYQTTISTANGTLLASRSISVLSDQPTDFVDFVVTLPVSPSSPLDVVAVAGDASAAVAFSPPLDSGGSVITSYTVTSNPGGVSVTASGSPIQVNGLTNGTIYTFTVTATNALGTGPRHSVCP
jgi:hypothetical protein